MERFLDLASEWADHIVVADQLSDDGTSEILKKYSKVRYVLNEGEFNEQDRSNLLLKELRTIQADKKLVVCLDADEALSLNARSTEDWERMLNGEPGEVFLLEWINLLKSVPTHGISANKRPFAYIDDGMAVFDQNVIIHHKRVPNFTTPKEINIDQIKNLHFIYLAKKRYMQKLYWYQCWETINKPQARAKDIFRMYNKHHNIESCVDVELETKWITSSTFSENIFEVFDDDINWHGREIINFINEHGAKYFNKCAIWDADWEKRAESYGIMPKTNFGDPRSILDKRIHSWLLATQDQQNRLTVRLIQKAIQLVGW
jgi:glycosyltransferase involved in cell wall biosynthesis